MGAAEPPDLRDLLGVLKLARDEKAVQKGLRTFRQHLKSADEGCRFLDAYLAHSPECGELEGLWDEHRRFKDKKTLPTLLRLFADILRVKGFSGEAQTRLARSMLCKRIKAISFHLSSGLTTLVNATLDLLVAMAQPHLGMMRELLAAMDWNHPVWGKISRRPKSPPRAQQEGDGDGGGPTKQQHPGRQRTSREAFVEFVVHLIRHADHLLLSRIITTRALAGNLMDNLAHDPPQVVLSVLQALGERVLQHNALSPSIIASLFSDRGLAQLADISGRGGGGADTREEEAAQAAHEMLCHVCVEPACGLLPARKDGSQGVTTDRYQQVLPAASRLDLLTIDQGIGTTHLSSQRPGVGKRVLRLLQRLQPSHSVRHFQFIEHVAMERPDIAAHFIPLAPYSLEAPSLSTTWVIGMSVLAMLLNRARPVLAETAGQILAGANSTSGEANAVVRQLLRNFLPASLSKSSLSKGLLHPCPLVVHMTLTVVDAMMGALGETFRQLQGAFNTTWARRLLGRMVVQVRDHLPEPQTLLALHGRLEKLMSAADQPTSSGGQTEGAGPVGSADVLVKEAPMVEPHIIDMNAPHGSPSEAAVKEVPENEEVMEGAEDPLTEGVQADVGPALRMVLVLKVLTSYSRWLPDILVDGQVDVLKIMSQDILHVPPSVQYNWIHLQLTALSPALCHPWGLGEFHDRISPSYVLGLLKLIVWAEEPLVRAAARELLYLVLKVLMGLGLSYQAEVYLWVAQLPQGLGHNSEDLPGSQGAMAVLTFLVDCLGLVRRRPQDSHELWQIALRHAGLTDPGAIAEVGRPPSPLTLCSLRQALKVQTSTKMASHCKGAVLNYVSSCLTLAGKLEGGGGGLLLVMQYLRGVKGVKWDDKVRRFVMDNKSQNVVGAGRNQAEGAVQTMKACPADAQPDSPGHGSGWLEVTWTVLMGTFQAKDAGGGKVEVRCWKRKEEQALMPRKKSKTQSRESPLEGVEEGQTDGLDPGPDGVLLKIAAGVNSCLEGRRLTGSVRKAWKKLVQALQQKHSLAVDSISARLSKLSEVMVDLSMDQSVALAEAAIKAISKKLQAAAGREEAFDVLGRVLHQVPPEMSCFPRAPDDWAMAHVEGLMKVAPVQWLVPLVLQLSHIKDFASHIRALKHELLGKIQGGKAAQIRVNSDVEEPGPKLREEGLGPSRALAGRIAAIGPQGRQLLLPLLCAQLGLGGGSKAVNSVYVVIELCLLIEAHETSALKKCRDGGLNKDVVGALELSRQGREDLAAPGYGNLVDLLVLALGHQEITKRFLGLKSTADTPPTACSHTEKRNGNLPEAVRITDLLVLVWEIMVTLGMDYRRSEELNTERLTSLSCLMDEYMNTIVSAAQHILSEESLPRKEPHSVKALRAVLPHMSSHQLGSACTCVVDCWSKWVKPQGKLYCNGEDQVSGSLPRWWIKGALLVATRTLALSAYQPPNQGAHEFRVPAQPPPVLCNQQLSTTTALLYLSWLKSLAHKPSTSLEESAVDGQVLGLLTQSSWLTLTVDPRPLDAILAPQLLLQPRSSPGKIILQELVDNRHTLAPAILENMCLTRSQLLAVLVKQSPAVGDAVAQLLPAYLGSPSTRSEASDQLSFSNTNNADRLQKRTRLALVLPVVRMFLARYACGTGRSARQECVEECNGTSGYVRLVVEVCTRPLVGYLTKRARKEPHEEDSHQLPTSCLELLHQDAVPVLCQCLALGPQVGAASPSWLEVLKQVLSLGAKGAWGAQQGEDQLAVGSGRELAATAAWLTENKALRGEPHQAFDLLCDFLHSCSTSLDQLWKSTSQEGEQKAHQAVLEHQLLSYLEELVQCYLKHTSNEILHKDEWIGRVEGLLSNLAMGAMKYRLSQPRALRCVRQLLQSLVPVQKNDPTRESLPEQDEQEDDQRVQDDAMKEEEAAQLQQRMPENVEPQESEEPTSEDDEPMIDQLEEGNSPCFLHLAEAAEKLLDRLVTHSQFVPLLVTSASSSPPLPPAVARLSSLTSLTEVVGSIEGDLDSSEGRPECSGTKEGSTRLEVMLLVETLFQLMRHHQAISAKLSKTFLSDFLKLLVVSYHGTLHDEDRAVLRVMFLIDDLLRAEMGSAGGDSLLEQRLGGPLATTTRFLFGAVAQAVSSDLTDESQQVPGGHLDTPRCALTCCFFPYWRTLRGDEVVPVHWRECPGIACGGYDPVMLLLWAVHGLRSSTVKVMDLVPQGVLAVCVRALAIRDKDIRALAQEALMTIIHHITSPTPQGPNKSLPAPLVTLMDFIKDKVLVSDASPPLPPATAIALADWCYILLHPGAPMYRQVQSAVGKAASGELSRLPPLTRWIYGGGKDHHEERTYALRLLLLLVDDLGSGGHLQRQHILEAVMALPSTATSTVDLDTLVLRVVDQAVRSPYLARRLVIDGGLVQWLTAIILSTASLDKVKQDSSFGFERTFQGRQKLSQVASRSGAQWAYEVLKALLDQRVGLNVRQGAGNVPRSRAADAVFRMYCETVIGQALRVLSQARKLLGNYQGLCHALARPDRGPVGTFGNIKALHGIYLREPCHVQMAGNVLLGANLGLSPSVQSYLSFHVVHTAQLLIFLADMAIMRRRWTSMLSHLMPVALVGEFRDVVELSLSGDSLELVVKLEQKVGQVHSSASAK